MLISVLSCRDNISDSGVVARVAGAAIDAVAYLPNMATEEFLACLSRAALERSAAAEGVRVEVRVKDTRARLVERFKDGIWLYPDSRFTPSAKDLADLTPNGPNEAKQDVGAGDDGETRLGDDDPIQGIDGDDRPPAADHSPDLAIAAE